MDYQKLHTWVEISQSAYANNLRFFKNRLREKTEYSVVIKANAYGHGMKEMAGIAVRNGVESFCVHALEEAHRLRGWGFTQDILILGPVLLNRLKEVIENDFRLVIFTWEGLEELNRLSKKMNKKVRIHLKLETGMNRQGIDSHDLIPILMSIKDMPLLDLEAVSTHFANTDEAADPAFALRQFNLFNQMAEEVKKAGFMGIKKHTANSAAILLFPESHFDLVRLGISQYGFWPSGQAKAAFRMKNRENTADHLIQVMTWKTRVGQVKHVAANQYIGYGCSYRTTRPSKIAVLPIGYSDGYDRLLSNRAHVLVKGKRAPVRGRVCMNLIMVDITDIADVRLEDEVVLLGKQGQEMISADDLAGLCGTINYEIVTRINWDIPRFVVK